MEIKILNTWDDKEIEYDILGRKKTGTLKEDCIVYEEDDFYKDLTENYSRINIDFKTYKKILKEYFTEVKKRILFKGFRFYFGFNLGYIKIERRQRDFKKMRVDWKKSNDTKVNGKYKKDKDGNPILIYFDDLDYPYLFWKKKDRGFPNKAAFIFKPNYRVFQKELNAFKSTLDYLALPIKKILSKEEKRIEIENSRLRFSATIEGRIEYNLKQKKKRKEIEFLEIKEKLVKEEIKLYSDDL